MCCATPINSVLSSPSFIEILCRRNSAKIVAVSGTASAAVISTAIRPETNRGLAKLRVLSDLGRLDFDSPTPWPVALESGNSAGVGHNLIGNRPQFNRQLAAV